MGRPTKLTPEVQAVIVEALTAGHYADAAASLAGIGEKTYYQWLERGAHGDEPFAAFAQAVEKASLSAVTDALAKVRAGGMGWQGSAWFLERRYPAKWGRRDPDHGVKTKLLEAELETVKAKLELLKAGVNPDGEQLIVVRRSWKQEPSG